MSMTAQSSAQERRVSIRVPVRLDARAFPGDRVCLVRDLSAHGARVQFDEPGGGPDAVVLVLWDSGQAFEAQAVWWLNNEIGVRFIRACELNNSVPTSFQDAKQAWQSSR